MLYDSEEVVFELAQPEEVVLEVLKVAATAASGVPAAAKSGVVAAAAAVVVCPMPPYMMLL